MEVKNTRLVKRKALEKGEKVCGALKKAKTVIDSIEGEEVELELPGNISLSTITMADNIEAMREMGRVMMESLNRQLEAQRDYNREREEITVERFREMMEGQNRSHREGTDILATEFEKMRLEKEQSRGRQTQKLPMYDGVNLEIDEWQDKVEAVLTCNKWDLGKLLETLPTCLTGQAKRAFDALTENDKRTKDSLFQNMRVKIDPQSEKKNKELFMVARRGATESITSFIDRCRMYIRRSGGDPTEPFAIDMLKFKVYDSLSPTDRKILNVTVGHEEELDKIITKADSMVSTQAGIIGAVVGQGQNNLPMGPVLRGNNGNIQGEVLNRGPRNAQEIICFKCGRPGHIQRYCRLGNPPFQGNQAGPRGQYGAYYPRHNPYNAPRAPQPRGMGYRGPHPEVAQQNMHGPQGENGAGDPRRRAQGPGEGNEPAPQNGIPVRDEPQNPVPLNF